MMAPNVASYLVQRCTRTLRSQKKNQQEAKKAVYELAGWIQHPTLSAGDSSMNLNGCSLLHTCIYDKV